MSTAVKPAIFVAFRLPPELSHLMDGTFDVHLSHGRPPALDDAQRARVQGLVTNGIRGAERALIDHFPNLEIIASLGTGLDALDLNAARERNLVVTNTPGVVADDVADLAMGLLIERSRQLVAANKFVLAGEWSKAPFPLTRSLTGMTLGIVGLGAIGTAVARRAEAFKMHVKWYGPRAKPDVPYEYVSDLEQLARVADALIVACAAAPGTHHLIDARILEALGPQGFLINVARGSIVDTVALIAALERGGIAGAALDVVEHQPDVPQHLLKMGNVMLTPHLGTATRETRARMGAMVIRSLTDHFAGRSPPHRVL